MLARSLARARNPILNLNLNPECQFRGSLPGAVPSRFYPALRVAMAHLDHSIVVFSMYWLDVINRIESLCQFHVNNPSLSIQSHLSSQTTLTINSSLFDFQPSLLNITFNFHSPFFLVCSSGPRSLPRPLSPVVVVFLLLILLFGSNVKLASTGCIVVASENPRHIFIPSFTSALRICSTCAGSLSFLLRNTATPVLNVLPVQPPGC